MQLEQQSSTSVWTGTVPTALDGRIIAVVVGIAAFAASLNVPYGGQTMAVAAFLILTAGGIAAHLLGARRLRRLTDELAERWVDAGGTVEDVTYSSSGLRTEWIVHTSEGPVTVGGLALEPISRLSISWEGTGDELPAAEVDRELERVADEWYRELFELS